MRKLITALVATATVIAGSLVGTATATTVTGVGSLPSLTNKRITCCQRRLLVRTVPMRMPWAGPERCARDSTRRRRGHWCSSKINCHSS